MIPRTPRRKQAPRTTPVADLERTFPDQVLKHLIRLAHPDHWQRGQPATELAHELLVALNDARAQLEAQL
jgi:hypothetical protein